MNLCIQKHLGQVLLARKQYEGRSPIYLYPRNKADDHAQRSTALWCLIKYYFK